MSGVQFLTNVMDKYGVVEFANSAESAEQRDGNMDGKKRSMSCSLNIRRLGQITVKYDSIDAWQLMHADQDLLHWLKQQENTYPRLSALAHSVLAVPATSAPSERVFSIAGLVGLFQAKRSNLAPNKVNKVIFVHNNAHLVDDRNSL